MNKRQRKKYRNKLFLPFKINSKNVKYKIDLKNKKKWREKTK